MMTGEVYSCVAQEMMERTLEGWTDRQTSPELSDERSVQRPRHPSRVRTESQHHWWLLLFARMRTVTCHLFAGRTGHSDAGRDRAERVIR